MTATKISVHSVNSSLIGLAELAGEREQPGVFDVPGGGRILIADTNTVALVSELLGTSARATNPYEQRRRKEFLRRAARIAVPVNGI